MSPSLLMAMWHMFVVSDANSDIADRGCEFEAFERILTTTL
jgi:hypothetical protein